MLKAFPVAGKKKSAEICNAFVQGASEDAEGSVFFGVDASNYAAWKARESWWYLDNAFFDEVRQKYFRVAFNRLQHSGLGQSDGSRFRSLDIPIFPWRDGSHILVCPQSEHFMRKIVGYGGDWLTDVMGEINAVTKRPVRVRPWSGDKARLAASLDADLEDAHAVVTWSSAAAITTTLRGVGSVSTGDSAASPMSTPMAEIEKPRRRPRSQWAGVLADNQFTLEEMRSGEAWHRLHSSICA